MRTFARSHPILAGAGIGLGWGIAMRLWMRFISTSPEFSWGGTLMILGVSAVVGALLGFARLRRWRRGIGWWRFTALSLLLLGAAGAAMWPAVILGGIALGRRRPAWLVSLLGAAALATQWPVIADNILDNSTMGVAEQVVGVVWYFPMLALQTWGFSVAFAPSLAEAPAPTRLKTALIGVLASFTVGGRRRSTSGCRTAIAAAAAHSVRSATCTPNCSTTSTRSTTYAKRSQRRSKGSTPMG